MSEAKPPRVPTRVNPPRAAVRGGNTVLSARTHEYHEPGFRTTLSVKSVTTGVARYGTRRSRYRVDPGVFALLEHGQEYTLDIRTVEATETCAVFFAPGFVEGAWDATARSPDSLLDDPLPRGADARFVERLYPKVGSPARALERLVVAARAARGGCVDELALEEGFYELAAALVQLDGDVRLEVERFPGRKRSTRLELYRRLHHAHDVIHSCYDEPLSIDGLARHACLSPHHFQHMYRARLRPLGGVRAPGAPHGGRPPPARDDGPHRAGDRPPGGAGERAQLRAALPSDVRREPERGAGRGGIRRIGSTWSGVS